MHRGRQSPVPILSDDDRRVLSGLVRRRQTPRGLATRAKVILLSADHPEWTLAEIGAQVGLCDDTVGTWRRRFLAQRLEGLSDAPKSGAPRTLQDEAIERVVHLTLDTVPEGETHWSTRSMAQASGMTQSAVHRIWRAFGPGPHLVPSFTLLLTYIHSLMSAVLTACRSPRKWPLSVHPPPTRPSPSFIPSTFVWSEQ